MSSVSVPALSAPELRKYCATCTCSAGFTPDQLTLLAEMHRQRYDKALCVHEPHEDGRRHFHSVFECRVKNPQSVLRMFERFYVNILHIQPVKGVSIVVKKTSDLIGAFHYLIDPSKNGVRLATFGWSDNWIRRQVRENLKKMPYKLLKRDDYTILMATGTNLIIEYAKRSGLPLSGKWTFRRVLQEMAGHGYSFHKVKIAILYCQVSARLGNLIPMGAWIDMELFNYV